MLTAYLAGSGGRVLIPDAVAIAEGESYNEVQFVDADGKVLAIFDRGDLAVYSENGLGPAVPPRTDQLAETG